MVIVHGDISTLAIWILNEGRIFMNITGTCFTNVGYRSKLLSVGSTLLHDIIMQRAVC